MEVGEKMRERLALLIKDIDFTKISEFAFVVGNTVINFAMKHPFVCLINVILLCAHLYLVHSSRERKVQRQANSQSTCIQRRAPSSRTRGGKGFPQFPASGRISQTRLSLRSQRQGKFGNSCRSQGHMPRMTSQHVTQQRLGTWAEMTTDDEEASTLNEVTWSNDPPSSQLRLRRGAGGEFGVSRCRGVVDKLSDVPEETEKTTSPYHDPSSPIGTVLEDTLGRSGRVSAGTNGDGDNAPLGKESPSSKKESQKRKKIAKNISDLGASQQNDRSPLAKRNARRRAVSTESPRKRNRECNNMTRAASEDRDSVRSSGTNNKKSSRPASLEDRSRGLCSSKGKRTTSREDQGRNTPRRGEQNAESPRKRASEKTTSTHSNEGANAREVGGVKKNDDKYVRSRRPVTKRTSNRRVCAGVMGCQLTRGSNKSVTAPTRPQQPQQRHNRRRQQQQQQQQSDDVNSEVDITGLQRCPSASSHSVCSSGAEKALAGQRSDNTLIGKRDSWIWFSHETRPSVENFATRKHRFQSEDPRVAELAAEIRRQDEMNKAIEREAGSIVETSTEMMATLADTRAKSHIEDIPADVEAKKSNDDVGITNDDVPAEDYGQLDDSHDVVGHGHEETGRDKVGLISDSDTRRESVSSNKPRCNRNSEPSKPTKPRQTSKKRQSLTSSPNASPPKNTESKSRERILDSEINQGVTDLMPGRKQTSPGFDATFRSTQADKEHPRADNRVALGIAQLPDSKTLSVDREVFENNFDRGPAEDLLIKENVTKPETTEVQLEDNNFPAVLVVSPVLSMSSSSPHSVSEQSCHSGQKAPSPSRSHFDVTPWASKQGHKLTNNTQATRLSPASRSPTRNLDWEQMSCASTKASTSSTMNASANKQKSPKEANLSPKAVNNLGVCYNNDEPPKCESPMAYLERHPVGEQCDNQQKLTLHVYSSCSPSKINKELEIDLGGSSISFTSEKRSSQTKEYKRETSQTHQEISLQGNIHVSSSECKHSSLSLPCKDELALRSPYTQSLTNSTLESSDSNPKEKLSTIKQVVLNNEVKDSVCKILFDAEQSSSSVSRSKNQIKHAQESTPEEQAQTETRVSPTAQRCSSPVTAQKSPTIVSKSLSTRNRRKSPSCINVFDQDYYLGKRAKQKLAGTLFGFAPISSSLISPSPSVTSQASSNRGHTRTGSVCVRSSDYKGNKSHTRASSLPRRGSELHEAEQPIHTLLEASNNKLVQEDNRSHTRSKSEDAIGTRKSLSWDLHDDKLNKTEPKQIQLELDQHEGITNVEQPDLLDEDMELHLSNRERSTVGNCRRIGVPHNSRRSKSQQRMTGIKNMDLQSTHNRSTTNYTCKEIKETDPKRHGASPNIETNDLNAHDSSIEKEIQLQHGNFVGNQSSYPCTEVESGDKHDIDSIDGRKHAGQSCSITRMARARRKMQYPNNGVPTSSKSGRLYGNLSDRQDQKDGIRRKKSSNNIAGQTETHNGDINLNHILMRQDDQRLLKEPENAIKSPGSSRSSRSIRRCFSKRHIPVSTLMSGMVDSDSHYKRSYSTNAYDVGTRRSFSNRSIESSFNIYDKTHNKQSSTSLSPYETSREMSSETKHVTNLRKTPNFYGKAKMRITRAVGLIHAPTQVSPARQAINSFDSTENLSKPDSPLPSGNSGPDVINTNATVLPTEVVVTTEAANLSGRSAQDDQLCSMVRKSSLRSYRSNRSSPNFQTKTAENLFHVDEHDPVNGRESQTKDVETGRLSVLRAKFRMDGKCGESASTNNSSNNVPHRSGSSDQSSTCSAAPSDMVVLHHNSPHQQPGVAIVTTMEVYHATLTEQMQIPLSFWPNFDLHDSRKKDDPFILSHSMQDKSNMIDKCRPNDLKPTCGKKIPTRSSFTCRQNLSSNLRRVHALAKSQVHVNSKTASSTGSSTGGRWAKNLANCPSRKLASALHNSKIKDKCVKDSMKAQSTKLMDPQGIALKQPNEILSSLNDKTEMGQSYELCTEYEHSQGYKSDFADQRKVMHNTLKPNLISVVKGNHQVSNQDSGYDEAMSTTEPTWGLTFPVSQHIPLTVQVDSVPCVDKMSTESLPKDTHTTPAKDGEPCRLTPFVETTENLDDAKNAAIDISQYSEQESSSVDTEEIFHSNVSSAIVSDECLKPNNTKPVSQPMPSPQPCESKHKHIDVTSVKSGVNDIYSSSLEAQEDDDFVASDPLVDADLDTENDIEEISESSSSCLQLISNANEPYHGFVNKSEPETNIDGTYNDCEDEQGDIMASEKHVLPDICTTVSASQSNNDMMSAVSDPSAIFISCRTNSEGQASEATKTSITDTDLWTTVLLSQSPDILACPSLTSSGTPSIDCLGLCTSPSCRCNISGKFPGSGSSSEHSQDVAQETGTAFVKHNKETESAMLNVKDNHIDNCTTISQSEYCETLFQCVRQQRKTETIVNDHVTRAGMTGVGSCKQYTAPNPSTLDGLADIGIDPTQVQLPLSSSDEKTDDEEDLPTKREMCPPSLRKDERGAKRKRSPELYTPQCHQHGEAPRDFKTINTYNKIDDPYKHNTDITLQFVSEPKSNTEILGVGSSDQTVTDRNHNQLHYSTSLVETTTSSRGLHKYNSLYEHNKNYTLTSASAPSYTTNQTANTRDISPMLTNNSRVNNVPSPSQRRAVIERRSMAFKDLIKRF